MGDFALVFKLLGLGVVMGIGTRICRQVGRDDIAEIATIVAIVSGLLLVIPLIVRSFREISTVFNVF